MHNVRDPLHGEGQQWSLLWTYVCQINGNSKQNFSKRKSGENVNLKETLESERKPNITATEPIAPAASMYSEQSALDPVFTKFYNDRGYRPERTEDHSWTLRWMQHPRTESMHSPRGALTETCHIYGEGLRLLPNAQSIWSVGLGLGYIEMLVASTLRAQGHQPKFLVSYETDEFLRESFLNWVASDATQNPILNEIAGAFPKSRQTLRNWHQEGIWTILESLEGDRAQAPKADLILFDAFSAKSSPELWSEEFLSDLLLANTESCCVLASYAATGNLNRAIRKAGFKRLDFAGWGGKKESTMAVRGIEEGSSSNQR